MSAEPSPRQQEAGAQSWKRCWRSTQYLEYGNGVGSNLQGGLESVMKSVIVSGTTGAGTYQYDYDAFNRRRLKSYPMDVSEEVFYDTGHQMLTTLTNDTLGPSTTRITEDYIWLDGKAVAVVRGKFAVSTTWTRQDEAGTSCARLGEAGKCGVFHVLNDYLPKPVLMFDSSTTNVVGTALYDEFGAVNRVAMNPGTVHPLASCVNINDKPKFNTCPSVPVRVTHELVHCTNDFRNAPIGSGLDTDKDLVREIERCANVVAREP